MKKYLILTFTIVVAICGALLYKSSIIKTPQNKKTSVQKIPKEKKENNIDIQISAVGDVLAHQDQLDSQYNSETKQYDFDNNFKYVSPYIKKSDLALANLETTLAGTDHGNYTGYPTFNSPDALAKAVKDAGFGVISAANNHSIDKGSYGLKRTVSTVKGMGETLIGLRENESDKQYTIQDVKGIKVGMTSFTFETAPVKGQKTLNSIVVPSDVSNLISSFNPDKPDHDVSKIIEQVNLMKQEGAELTIVFMHWGVEYEREPNKYQKEMAQALADAGVDIIFGSHPHVIEPITYLNSSKTGKQCLVVYSMGNFLSNQRIERTNNKYTEDGMIVNVGVEKNIKTNAVSIVNTSYIPTWVDRTASGKHYNYEIVPLPAALKDKAAFDITDNTSEKKAEDSYTNTTSIVPSLDSRITVVNQ